MVEREPDKDNKENQKLELADIVAFMIAAFQIMVPAALVLMGVLMIFYFLLRWWSGF